ncbi:MAG TPA: polysaccharide biosynthesis tyrosine autokinase [Acidisarcina sp.]
MSEDHSLVPASQRAESQQLARLAPAQNSYNIVDLWKVVSRRRRILLTCAGVVLALGLAYTLFTPKLYRAEAKLQILKQDAAADFSDSAQSSSTAAADALDFNLAAQTQVDVLESRNMALRVINELHLDQLPDYQPRSDAAEAGLPLQHAPKRLAYVIEKFSKRLKVSSVSGTRLISVSFLDRDPNRAAQVVNQLLADFIDYNFQVRYNASAQATSFLSNELQQMKAQVDQSQANVARLQQQSGIYGVDETNNAVNAKLEQLNAQLTVAQANRAMKQSIYKLALTRNPEVLAGMIGEQATGANTTNAPLQLLRQQQAEAAASYAELNAHYGPQYPKVIQAGQRLQSIQASIKNETDRLVGQATAEYKVAADTEASAAKALQDQKTLAAQMNRDATVYTSAKHEADTSRDLYEQLLRRMKEAGVLAGMRSTNLNILDPAIPPDKAAQPLLLIYTLLALLTGLLLGVVAAFLAEVFDGTVHDPQRIEDALGTPVLALIPPAERSLPKAAVQSLRKSTFGDEWQYQTTAKAPRSVVAEAFRILRTAILSALPGKQSKVLAITSTSEGEGKSFTTFNLAAAFAQSGRSVVVVDADLRKRTLTKALGYDNLDGLDEAVSDISWQKYITTYEEIPGLFVLPAGQHAHYPADVLGSVTMQDLLGHLRKSFDIVLIDTPSILAVTDTVSLSRIVDAVMVVAKCGSTAQHSLARTHSVLQRAGARVLGIVLNGIDFESTDFYYYWGKQSDGYKATPAQILSPATQVVRSGNNIVALLVLGLTLVVSSRGFGQTEAATATAPGFTPGSTIADAQKLVIGEGDLLSILVYDAPELTQEVRVGSNGTIHLTLLGDVKAAGIQPDQLASQLEDQFRSRGLIASPQVSVSIKEFTTQGVTVEGEVKKPGLYPIYSARSLVDVIALAEGPTPAADTVVSIRRRGTGAVETVTMTQDDGRQVADSNVRVYAGDTVIVPRAGLAYVLGDVTRPGGYIMHDNGHMTILQAISEAQGTTRNASLKHVILLRKTANGTETIPVQLKAMMRGKEKDQVLMSGDILFVPSSGLKTLAEGTQSIASSVAGSALYVVAN